jgi:uncharacterized protein (DUF1800 family)
VVKNVLLQSGIAFALVVMLPGAATPVPSAYHVLNRLGYGPLPGEIPQVQREGTARWIADQLAPGRDDPALADRLATLDALAKTPGQLAREFPNPEPTADPARESMDFAPPPRKPGEITRQLAQAKLLRAVYGHRPLDEAMVDFWFNHFNVTAQKGPIKWLIASYEQDVIRPRAMGRFRDLLGAVAHSPAMLHYLDNTQSVAEGAARGGKKRGLNENYARELLELHTLGVDGGYSQTDVREAARVLTGWSAERVRDGEPAFKFRARLHDRGAKRVLGQEFPAGRAQDEGERLLDLLAAHPSTATFIAGKLVRRFVSDNPPASLVARAAGRFKDTGGDIRETMTLILTSPEFAGSAGQKTKTPFEFVASALRATGASTDAGIPVLDALRRLGQPPYICAAPTGYPDKPELWTTPGGLLTRLNFANALVSNRIPGTTVALDRQTVAQRDDPLQILESLNGGLLGGTLGDRTRGVLESALGGKRGLSRELLFGLLLGSPEFQVR